MSTKADDPDLPAGVKALFDTFLDYAGLLPPTRLPLGDAVRHWDRHRRGPYGWMLGRFVCPAGRLVELETATADAFDDGEVGRLSMLCRSARDDASLLTTLAEDATSGGAFLDQAGDDWEITAVELRLPDRLTEGNAADLSRTISEALEILHQAGLGQPDVYFEASLGTDWRDTTPRVVEALAGVGADPKPGLKIRCGGLTPDAFPPPEQVAGALAASASAGLPMKATAGLHHPVRHRDDATGITSHGFLNLFGASVLAVAESLGAREPTEVVADTDADAFAVDDAGFRWRTHRVAADAVVEARRCLLGCFGSCSFDEPRTELGRLGILPASASTAA